MRRYAWLFVPVCGVVLFLTGCAEGPSISPTASPTATGAPVAGPSGGATSLPITARSSSGGATVTFDTPFGQPIWDDCTQEYVVFSGTVHTVFNPVHTSSGGFSVVLTSNFQNVQGIGQTSGRQYRGTGGKTGGPPFFSYTFHVRDASQIVPGETSTTRLKISWVAQGSASDLTVAFDAHYTINANGDWTASFSDFTAECS